MSLPKDITNKEYGNITHYEVIEDQTRRRLIDNIFKHHYIKEHIDLLSDYESYLIRKKVKLESRRYYLQNLSLLLRQISKHPKDYTIKDIDAYLAFIDTKYKPKTIKERRLFLVYFFEWFTGKKKKDIDLIKDLEFKSSKDKKLPEELLTPEEIKQLAQVADNFRDKCIIFLLYELAARKGEFLQLRIKHLNGILKHYKQKFAWVDLPQGKTSARKLPVIYSVPHIINWLNSHPQRDNPEAPLFINIGSHTGRGLGADGLKRIVKVLGKRANINKNIYPHLFRHSRLTELAKELTEQELKKFAGWTENSDMASIYVHLSGEDAGNKILANAGLINTKNVKTAHNILNIVECPSCKQLCSSEQKICTCGKILSIEQAQQEIDKYQSIEEQFEKQANVLKQLEPTLHLLHEFMKDPNKMKAFEKFKQEVK